MARLERQQIIALSEKTENVYYDMEDELLVLIAEYLAQGETAYTIAELYNRIGQLSDEAIRIIAKYSKKSMAEVEEIMEEAMMIALDDIERQMQEAAKSGKLEKAPPLKQSQRVKNVVQSAARQSGQKMQQMQPTILNSVIVEYQEAVNDVMQEKQRIQQQNYDREIKYDPEDLEDTYREAVYEITRDREITSKAIEKAIDKLADKGITGYVDSAGRHWQADTYATMVIRTNAHNVAIDATRERQADYGSDLFQISSHNGARELCYPYQGKICSWTSATGGSFIDGAGVKREYLSLENDTSYGEPAGIFGINCGHHPLPIIPGVSIVHEQPVQDPEENKREYEESQKQRYLERQIRDAKRQYEMQRVSGADEETLKRYKQNIENKQQNMREFIHDTGRTRRYDREKIQQQKYKVAMFEGEIEPPKPLEAPLNVLEPGTEPIILGKPNGIVQEATIVEGKDISRSYKFDKANSEFDFEIEDVIHQQGYDGLPTIMTNENEFYRIAEENEFIAQRTYTGETKDIADAYREMLYHGKFYVDCSTGGAQYGQGMYCAADYYGELTGGIGEEMEHYAMLNKQRALERNLDRNQIKEIGEIARDEGYKTRAWRRGSIDDELIKFIDDYRADIQEEYGVAPVSYIETMTLDKSAKIISFQDLENEFRDYKTNYSRIAVEEYIERLEEFIDENTITSLKYEFKIDGVDYEQAAAAHSKMSKEDEIEFTGYLRDVRVEERAAEQRVSRVDIGSFAVMKGHDAINAEGHGQSGSYTVVLNRTKLIILQEEED